MNEIEQSIETLRKISDIETNRNYKELHELKSFNYDLLTAIEALKEKAEREKGCEYCKGDVDYRPALIDSDGEYVYIDGNGKMTLNDLDDKQLNYCPMCGRKLVEE